MRLAVLSDIHANPEALEAVLADARAQDCPEFVVLGDVVPSLRERLIQRIEMGLRSED